MKTRLILVLAAAWIAFPNAESYAAVGRTVGQFQASQTGSAQYSIPIWAPPGPRGLQPTIALVYDSRSGAGYVGVGWSLQGLGAITRCNETYAQDAAPAPVALVVGDGYCINGSRLRLTSGTYGTEGSVYQTEIADFSQITANGTAGNGPAYFTVQGRNGLTYQYGYTDAHGYGANSEVLASGTSTAYAWLLSKVTDRAGNSMAINYIAGTSTAVPGTIYWTAASAGSSSYNYQMIFTYSTNNPQTSVYGYVAGAALTNVNLLTDITVEYASTVVKKYVLTYQTGPTTGRNQLKGVQECADSGATDCLSPTTMTYQNGTLGISASATSVASGAASAVHKYDFNGDGYTDLAYYNGSTWYVAFGSASGYGTAVNSGITSATALFGDLQGTGTDQILAINGSTWYAYKWNGTSFTGTSTGLASDNATMLADVDGDGRPDLVYVSVTLQGDAVGQPQPLSANSVLEVDVRFNTSSSSAASFSPDLSEAWSLPPQSIGGARLIAPDKEASGLRSYDFDGDGRNDVAVVFGSGSPATTYYYLLLSQGRTFVGHMFGSSTNINIPNPQFINWNNDACTDTVWNGTIYISGCDGAAGATLSVPGGTVLTVADYDADGRTDVLVPDGSTIGVYRSTGTGLGSLASTSIAYNAACSYFTFDANGDGLDDLGCLNSSGALTFYPHNGTGTPPDLASSFTDGYGNSASPTYASIVQSNYTEHPSSQVLPTFPDRDYIGPLYVVKEAVFSDPSAVGGTYNQTFQYYAAWTNLQGRGFEGFQTIYTADSRNTSGSPPLYRYQYFEQQFPWTGMTYRDLLTTGVFYPTDTVATPNTLAQATLSSTADEERYFPYFTNVTTTRKEVGGSENGDSITSTSTNYTYDAYGNATSIASTVTDTDPGSPYTGDTWTTTTTNTTDISANQTADLAAWCLNMLDETQVAFTSSLSGSTAVTRTQKYTPDTPAACRIKTIVTEPTANSGNYTVTESLTFDAFGNVATDTLTGANMPSSPASRETQYNWGTTGQFLSSQTVPVGTVANPATATTGWSYTSNEALTFGVPDSRTDPNSTKSDPIVTSWTYDPFGRKSKETRPDGTSTTWTWTICTAYCNWSNSVYQVAQSAYQTNGTTLIRTDSSLYDPLDRVIETSGPTVSGSTAIVQTRYNSLGLLYQQSMPFISGGTVYEQTSSYDALNRLIAVSRPISSTNSTAQTTSYGYAGRTTTVKDPYGNATTTITDVNGWLRRTQDALGYRVTRAYDAAGSLTGVTDSVGNTLQSNLTYKYGIKPFLVSATDADLGSWTFTVDSLGERIGWTDAKAQAFSMTYDAQSRPVTRTEPDLFTQWTYGTAAPAIGKLTSECTQTVSPCSSTSALYYEARGYDSLSRPSTRSITQTGNPGNDPGGAFLYTTGYSATTGFPSSLTYPISTSGVALNVTYGYQYGLLQTVNDTTDTTATCGSTCTLWTANAMNGFGQITEETLGNGVITNRTYDTVTSWLKSATAGVGGGAALLNQSYLEDDNGNVTQRQNNTLALTENFFYDADQRLVCATLGSSCSSNTFVYDGGSAGPGNITTQAGVGTYTYPAPGGVRPHAVTLITGTFNGITNPQFAYDANGNMTARASSTANITWSSYNYPIAISGTDVTGSEEVQFNYGPDRQRWEQTYTGPGGTEKTYYLGGLMDLVFVGGVANYRHYVYAGKEPIAVYSRTGSTNTMSYFLEDHQGGVATISSNSGASDVNESFTAFGLRREPTTWTGPPSAAELQEIANLSRQGYTFQTWLGQSMGLNHMNGRVQDALSGRFLSADPTIPDPANAQSYNRYSYVSNSPLSRSDPTGFYDLLQDGGTPVEITVTGSLGGVGPYSFDVADAWNSLQQQYAPSLNPVDMLDPIAVIAKKPHTSKPHPAPPTVPQIIWSAPAQGHAYSTRNQICQRSLTASEISDLISRFTVPNVYLQGQPLGTGIHMVAAWGIPGGFVTTTFSADGLTGFNQTTPFHIFTGTVVRSVDNTGTGADMVTYGYGGYPPGLPTSPYSSSLTTSSIDIGAILDQLNDVMGPMVFDAVDQQAARFAQNHYSGC